MLRLSAFTKFSPCATLSISVLNATWHMLHSAYCKVDLRNQGYENVSKLEELSDQSSSSIQKKTIKYEN